ncbi:MAG: hypothetical protein IPN86_18785 [Saprospiraceae bacterium]|nr:hypothetical protein [Saprospiraceae bacterium]
MVLRIDGKEIKILKASKEIIEDDIPNNTIVTDQKSTKGLDVQEDTFYFTL